MHYPRNSVYKICCLVISLFFVVSLSGCKKKPETQLGAVATPIPDSMLAAVSTPPPYSINEAKGVYGGFTTEKYRFTFLGFSDYLPVPQEAEYVKSGEKPVVFGYSIEPLTDGYIEFSTDSIRAVDMNTMTPYRPKWKKDNEIEQWVKEKTNSVMCGRLVYILPDTVEISDVMAVIEDGDNVYKFSSNVPDEEISGATIDYTNMCELCSKQEYDFETLVIDTCEICGKKFTSGHEPRQRICFSCSVLNGYCTQCTRFISKNATIIKEK